MKILVVSQSFWPDHFAVNDTVETLVRHGHSVTVLTGLPDYTSSRIPPEYRHGKNRVQNYHGAKVIRCPIVARRSGVFFRCLNYLSFAFFGWCQAAFRKWEEFDLIYVWQVSPVTMAVPALKLKKRYRKPLFLYCLDIWPECVKAMGFGERSPLFRLVAWWSKRLYRACDHIAVSSEPFFDYLEQVNGFDRGRMSYLPQYGGGGFAKLDLTKEPDGRADLLYAGNIGYVTDLPVLLRACARLKSRPEAEKLTVHIAGSGSDAERCRRMAEELGLEGLVRFHGHVPAGEIAAYYRRADACMLMLNGDSRIGSTLPGKLQTYMAAAKPVIAAANGACREVISQSGCGLVVPAGDDAALAEAILAFLGSRETWRGMGDRGRSWYQEHFNKEKHFSALEAELNALAAPSLARE